MFNMIFMEFLQVDEIFLKRFINQTPHMEYPNRYLSFYNISKFKMIGYKNQLKNYVNDIQFNNFALFAFAFIIKTIKNLYLPSSKYSLFFNFLKEIFIQTYIVDYSNKAYNYYGLDCIVNAQ